MCTSKLFLALKKKKKRPTPPASVATSWEFPTNLWEKLGYVGGVGELNFCWNFVGIREILWEF